MLSTLGGAAMADSLVGAATPQPEGAAPKEPAAREAGVPETGAQGEAPGKGSVEQASGEAAEAGAQAVEGAEAPEPSKEQQKKQGARAGR